MDCSNRTAERAGLCCSFFCDRKVEYSVLTFYHKKTLRVDRTAAEKKHIAKSNPPQAENPAGQDSFLQ